MRTMLRLTRAQRALTGDKLADLANLAGGALVFGQAFAGGSVGFMLVTGLTGLLLWALLSWAAMKPAKED